MNEELDIKVVIKKDGVYSFELRGSVDSDTSPELKKALENIIGKNIKAVVFNMEGVGYISSAGIGVIVWAKNTLKEKNAAFCILKLQPKVEKVFEVLRILPMLNVFRDIAAAEQYLEAEIARKP